MATDRRRPLRREPVLDVLKMLVLIAGATGMGFFFRQINVPETNIVIAYILSVLLTARFTRGYIHGIISSVIATAAYNYFFTEPYYTFSVNDPTYLITFGIMTITAIITSALTSKVILNGAIAQVKEAEASELYRLTNHLTDAANIPEIASITVRTVSSILNCHAACLCFDENGMPETSYILQRNDNELIRREISDVVSIKNRIDNLRLPYDIGEEFYDWPIYGRDSTLGMLRIPKTIAEKMSEPQTRLLHSIIESTALAIDRFRSVQDRIKSNEEIVQERYRSNLLRAISHDLRTPLAGIMGTSEMLIGMTKKDDDRYQLAEGIYAEAIWLHSLVENILSLTRIRDGKLDIKKQPEAIEEAIGVAVAAISKRSPDYDFSVHIPARVMLIPMDAKLIEQVLVNLLDNAVKNSPPGTEININVEEEKARNVAVISVADHGSGIAEADLQKVFQMFYTTHGQNSDAHRGIGLGLAICESIVVAHGGTIEAHNRSDGEGAVFVFTLPLEVA